MDEQGVKLHERCVKLMEINYTPETRMQGTFPHIRKCGAVSPCGESSPFVWRDPQNHGKETLMRLELLDPTRGTDPSQPPLPSSATVKPERCSPVLEAAAIITPCIRRATPFMCSERCQCPGGCAGKKSTFSQAATSGTGRYARC